MNRSKATTPRFPDQPGAGRRCMRARHAHHASAAARQPPRRERPRHRPEPRFAPRDLPPDGQRHPGAHGDFRGRCWASSKQVQHSMRDAQWKSPAFIGPEEACSTASIEAELSSRFCTAAPAAPLPRLSNRPSGAPARARRRRTRPPQSSCLEGLRSRQVSRRARRPHSWAARDPSAQRPRARLSAMQHCACSGWSADALPEAAVRRHEERAAVQPRVLADLRHVLVLQGEA